MAGPLLHLIGRKSTVLLVSPLWLVAWILIATASQWPYMVLGRFLSGFGAGLTLPTAQIYVRHDLFRIQIFQDFSYFDSIC